MRLGAARVFSPFGLIAVNIWPPLPLALRYCCKQTKPETEAQQLPCRRLFFLVCCLTWELPADVGSCGRRPLPLWLTAMCEHCMVNETVVRQSCTCESQTGLSVLAVHVFTGHCMCDGHQSHHAWCHGSDLETTLESSQILSDT